MNITSECEQRSFTFPDILALRYRDSLVYVRPAPDHDKAVQCAKYAFHELQAFDNDQIFFSLTVTVESKYETVTITPAAWPAVVSKLTQFEILNVFIVGLEEDTPPIYTETSLAATATIKKPRFPSFVTTIQSWFRRHFQ
ncbi:hypothetical protein PUNSTDRAFT_133398 [Punctularia strigosozonata HHB-11173 SS5]|uniref:uncharacterized protein n=1 Tax=Punctularia strigosozonata (strain HHB-11173) TaxID=741275 RepID=UPI0004416DAA|nr:uncharacterized protein PUNSTDRAFT_133398 [Punctularia strigosozonata HHB-11173 SS5]EIN09621.1 hypothetical protein PUNSTDRAFT_133398 [Punctularia strigosozonata HHB-11173 SS5]